MKRATKQHSGFSYMEMIIALSLFSILLMAAIPLLNQASRNMAFAQDNYNAHLAAQSLMLNIRETLRNNPDSPAQIATSYATQLGVETYSIFIWNTNASPIAINSPCAPEINASLHGLDSFALAPNTSVISVLIFNEFEAIAGRAIGVF